LIHSSRLGKCNFVL